MVRGSGLTACGVGDVWHWLSLSYVHRCVGSGVGGVFFFSFVVGCISIYPVWAACHETFFFTCMHGTVCIPRHLSSCMLLVLGFQLPSRLMTLTKSRHPNSNEDVKKQSPKSTPPKWPVNCENYNITHPTLSPTP